MKPYIQPAPDDQPRPAEQPTPAKQPRRRTFTLPTFVGGATKSGVKTFATITLVMGMVGAQAQTPTPTTPSNPGVPTRPMDPDDRQDQRTNPQQPGMPQARSSDGWVMFDDRSTQQLGLQQDQLKRLREVDGRYQKDYSGLGNKPSESPDYQLLTERRNADVKGILTPDQYQRWMTTRNSNNKRMDRDTDGGMNKDGSTTPGTTKPSTSPSNSTTTTPRD
jgi:hypothetical protein